MKTSISLALGQPLGIKIIFWIFCGTLYNACRLFLYFILSFFSGLEEIVLVN